MGVLLEWPESWCLQTRSGVLQGEGVWQETYLVVLAWTDRKTAVDLTQYGVFSAKPHLMLDTLPTCLHAINSLLRHDMGRAEKSRICENM